MKKIVIYGLGPLAELMNFYFSEDTDYEVVAFTVDKQYLSGTTFLNKPVVEFERVSDSYSPGEFDMFVAIGYKNMGNREKLYRAAKSKGYRLVNYISSKAITYSDLIIGDNNVIMGNVSIEPFVEIGHNNIVWSSVNICHDSTIHSHCFIAAGTILGGFSTIEDQCFVGFDTTIKENTTLSRGTTIGAKSLVLRDTESNCTYFGHPAIKR